MNAMQGEQKYNKSACLTCGKPTRVAVSSGRALKYCSRDCSRRMGTGYRKIWIQNCKHCGKLFTGKRVTAEYCSDGCCTAARRESRRVSYNHDKACPICERLFSYPKPMQVYCSSACRAVAGDIGKHTSIYILVCDECGELFVSRYKKTKWCSSKCSAACNHRRRYQPRPKKQVVCVMCGAIFQSSHRGGVKYCGYKCRRAGAKRLAKGKRGSNKNLHKARCEQYGTRYTKIDPMDVFERDHWLCMICLAPVDKDRVVPDPLAATVDHTIPLSKGGEHVMSNVRCAHFACNSILGDGRGEWRRQPPGGGVSFRDDGRRAVAAQVQQILAGFRKRLEDG